MKTSGEPTAPPVTADTLAAALGAIVRPLNEIVAALTTGQSHLVFGAAPVQQEVDNWPVSGSRRTIAVPRGIGGGIFAVPANTNAVDLLPMDPGRAGLSICNYGTAAVFLYTARAGDVTSASDVLWLSSGGGSWDGKLSGELWGGPVSVASVTGSASSLAVAVL